MQTLPEPNVLDVPISTQSVSTQSASDIQFLASNPLQHVWVSAHAGSGKTKVLSDRVLRLLLAGANPSHIVCITYTKNAATEMRDRINKRLAEWPLMDDAQLHDSLQKLTRTAPSPAQLARARQLFITVLDAEPGLRIHTIHAFCQSILGRFPLEAGIAPYFSLAEEEDSARMQREAGQQLLRQWMHAPDAHPALSAALTHLTQSLGERSYNELMKALIEKRRHIAHIMHQPGGMKQSLQALQQALSVLPDAPPPTLSWSAQELAKLHEACLFLGTLTNLKTLIALHEKLARMLESHAQHSHAEAYLRCFFTDKEERGQKIFSSLQKNAAPYADLFEAEADKYEQYIEQKRTHACYHNSRCALIVAESLHIQYETAKAKEGMLDYDDLIIHTHQLLAGSHWLPWVLYKLDGGIDHLLLDEAQDTSPEQWGITRALAEEFFAGLSSNERPRSLFVVGDVKQSIYRFQQADPASFHAMHQHWCDTGMMQSLTQNTSFRSSPAILAMVDAVLAHTMPATPQTQPAFAPHIAHHTQRPGLVECWPLIETSEKEHPDGWILPDERTHSTDNARLLAEQVAQVAKRWLDSNIILDSTKARPKASDILILLRSRKVMGGRLIPEMMQALHRANIPVSGLDRLALHTHLAVMDLLNFARFLLLPEDDYTLACLLKSPLYNIDDTLLCTLTHERLRADPPRTLWQQLQASAHDVQQEGLQEGLQKATQELRYFLGRVDFLSPHALFSELLYSQKGWLRLCERLGDEALEPLQLFLHRIYVYEQNHPHSLQACIQWCEQTNNIIKRDTEQHSDVVRIMTIHGAKGLEAPIVILPDATSASKADTPMLLAGEYQHTPVLLAQWNKHVCAFTQPYLDAYKAENAAERCRLLYVALTRAREGLHIMGVGQKTSGDWYKHCLSAIKTLPNAQEHNGIWSAQHGEWEQATPVCTPAMDAAPIPAMLNTMAPEEQSPVRRSPSQMDADTEHMLEVDAYSMTSTSIQTAIARGICIHRLLELLPQLAAEQHHATALRYAAQALPNLSQAEHLGIANDVCNLMHHPEYGVLFSQQAIAEAAFCAEVEGTSISGQIDRLWVGKDSVWIVDFKTGTPPSTIPQRYRTQLSLYAKAMQRIYPLHTTRASLLYTSAATLVDI